MNKIVLNAKDEILKNKLINDIKEGKTTDEIMKQFEIHGTTCEVYSRIVGFFRPLSNWNNGKQSEYKDRVEFEL